MVDTAISRARAIPRAKALRHVVTHQQTRRSICVVTHDPRLPDIKAIQLKHWTRMKHASQYLEDVFPEPLKWHLNDRKISKITLSEQEYLPKQT